MEKKVIDTGMTAYEVQQKQYESVTPLDMIDCNRRICEVADKMIESDSVYFMLLCHELRDYTTFVLTSSVEHAALKQALQETLENRGDIMDIYDNAEGGWDIWIRDVVSKRCHMRKLFDASDFIEIV